MAELGNGMIKSRRNWLPILLTVLVGYATFIGLQMLQIYGDSPNSPKRWSIRLRSEAILMETMQAEVITHDPLRVYLVNVHMGTPPRKLSLIMDTGSDLTWTQCQPCAGCYQQKNPIFNPEQSSSYASISCDAEQCPLAWQSLRAHGHCSADRDPCIYSLAYLDKSTSRGTVATETVTLESAGDSGRAGNGEVSIPEVTFGCGHSNGGSFSPADGILGLGRGLLSFPEQIGATKFAYCLQQMDLDVDATNPTTSFLTFGEQSDSLLAGRAMAGVAGLQVQYTPMLHNPRNSRLYYVGIVQVMVGDSVVPISPDVFSINHTDGSGGAFLDTGTILTYLVTQAFDAVVSTFRKAIPYPTALQTDFPRLCFKAAAPLKELRDLPQFRIVFENGAVLSPPMSSIFHEWGRGLRLKCLLIDDASSLGFRGSIIGNHMQHNSIMVFDIGRQRIGFAPADCAALN